MAGESISTLILFIAAMLVAGLVAGALVTNVSDISSSIGTHSSDVRDQIDTDIEVISDPGSEAVYDEGDGNISVLLKNTGEKTLASDGADLDVLVNGEYVSSESFAAELRSSDASSDAWRSGDVVELEIDQGLDSGEHRVVVTVNGDRETLEFYIESES